MDENSKKTLRSIQISEIKEPTKQTIKDNPSSKCPMCGAELSPGEISARRCLSCEYLFPNEKVSLSMFPVISLFVSIVGVLLHNAVMNYTNLIGLWAMSSFISIIFPLVSKYFRNRDSKEGKSIEIVALILGSFNLYSYLFTTTEISAFFIFAIIALVCFLYVKLFNDV